MALRSDSYGTVAEVAAFCKVYLDGEITFTPDTVPTLTQVEKFVDRASSVLNMRLRKHGFAPSAVTANSTAKLVMDGWVVEEAVRFVELAQPGAGFSADEGTRLAGLSELRGAANGFIDDLVLALKREGVTVADPTHQGLTFTALDKHSERSDPDSNTLEQPRFRRRQFDAVSTTNT